MKIEINLDDKFFEEKLKEYRAASFARALELMRDEATALRKEKKRYPTYLLDSKILTYEFARLLNLKTPKIYQISEPIEQIEFKDNTVVKPVYEHSATGVFMVHSGTNIRYINRDVVYSNSEAAKKHALGLLKDKKVRLNKWMVEELIQDDLNIARDIKFYCFYGEIGLILESDRIPKLKRCWYDKDLNIVNTGKYVSVASKAGTEGLKELAAKACSISLEIPAPFVRIDFLKQGNDVYLGEFTPAPGGFHRFNHTWDLALGEMYHKAMTRLTCDVAAGKVFTAYNALTKSETKVIEYIRKENVG